MELRGAGQFEACYECIWGPELEKDSEISDITHQRLEEIEVNSEKGEKWASFQSV